MNRAVIYARYSTDLQNDRSIEDQIALCRAYAERTKLTVVGEYADRAQSGSSAVNRHGWQKLMRDADGRGFDVVIAEDLDRISRDEADYHTARKRLAFLDIKIHGAHSGEVTGIEGSVRAMMGALVLENLAHKTRRGLAGLVQRGLHAGGRAYGYRLIPGRRGEFTIDDDEAGVIRRIFSEYVSGRTPREIAHGLNRDGIASPRGGTWNASTINGNKARGIGILQNHLYAGRIVWNKTRKIKSPNTGKRLQRPNPAAAWHQRDVPHLAIVDRKTFDAAQTRKAERSAGHPSQHRRPRHILSGLLRCAACGGGMSTAGKDKSGRTRIRCSAWIESNTCPDPKTFYLPTVEDAVLSGLRRELRHPAVLAEYAKTYAEERRRLAQRTTRDRAQMERRLNAAQAELDRAVRALIKGLLSEEEAAPEIAKARAERDRLKAELAAAPEAAKTVTLHPAALQRYERQLERLQETLHAGIAAGDTEAAAAIRDLVETVTVRPDPDRRGGVQVEIAGRLNALLGAGMIYPDRIRSIVGEIAGAQGRNRNIFYLVEMSLFLE
jgi:site-specific DNA recombinase